MAPRLVLYHQTINASGRHVSLLPLLNGPSSRPLVTHVIVGAIHVNATPGDVTLNDDPWDAEKHAPMWEEVKALQDKGVVVLGMLGGAARGSFTRLDGDAEQVCGLSF